LSSSSFRASSASGWDGGGNVTVPLEQGKKYLQDLLQNNNNTNTKRNNNGSNNNVNIQGLIIGWPRQPDGWLGYQCGRVFYHLLDAVETTARPAVCLFDDHHHHGANTTTVLADDAWGRNPVYSRITAAAKERRSHVASREQYYTTTTTTDSSTTTLRGGGGAVDLAELFCREHWPEYYQQQELEEEGQEEPFNNGNLDMWAATSSFHGSLLPRSAPTMTNKMQQQQHSWMALSSDHHHPAAASIRHRSLASA
jgi:hypothetical protein